MLGLVVILLLVGVTLSVLLWVGTLFLQGYFYTEPTSGILWQAPAAGGALAVFLLLWCIINVSAAPTTEVVPYDTLFRFTAVEDLGSEPAPKIWAVRKGVKEPILYKRIRTVKGYDYLEANTGNRWSSMGVEAILVPRDKDSEDKIRFERNKDADSESRRFVSAEGWGMGENNLGQPLTFRFGRFLMNMVLNLLHLVLWFVCLWLLLRFQWSHALGLAVALWLVMTLVVLPMLMNRCGEVARQRTAPETPPAAARRTREDQRPDLGSGIMGTPTITSRLSSSST